MQTKGGLVLVVRLWSGKGVKSGITYGTRHQENFSGHPLGSSVQPTWRVGEFWCPARKRRCASNTRLGGIWIGPEGSSPLYCPLLAPIWVVFGPGLLWVAPACLGCDPTPSLSPGGGFLGGRGWCLFPLTYLELYEDIWSSENGRSQSS